MWFLIGLVTLVGLLCALDLILTLGVIRRLREHSAELNRVSRGPMPSITRGEAVTAFETVTTDGDRLSREQLVDDTVVAFFAPDCKVCREKMPKFLEYARTLPGGRRQVLAVVVGEEDECATYATMLAPVAQVVVEEQGGPLSLAFAVIGFPALLQVARDAQGRLVATTDNLNLDTVGAAVTVTP
jgi:thiol-disulfide isomerase/thioredoxin